jgi:HEAT repeat protein/cyclophilin family peptidyl-prolyl cis-trans isomerase
MPPMRRLVRTPVVTLLASALVVGSIVAQRSQKAPLRAGDVDEIATLLMLEDARTFDEPALSRMLKSPHPEVRRRAVQSVGRIANKAGAGLVETAREDKDAEVAATAVWAAGQLRDPAAIPWLTAVLKAPRSAAGVAREAAIALGKIQAPDARAALVDYLSTIPLTAAPDVIGEALLSLGRFPAGGDLAPVIRWTSHKDVEVRWRATWALFRPRDPAGQKDLLTLSGDPSAEVRYWAVRGLVPLDGIDPAPAAARLRALVDDPDRRVRTEALRALGQHDDDLSVKTVVAKLDDPDTWLSVSAAEVLARQEKRAETVVPRLVAAAAPGRPLALRLTARQSLGRLGASGTEALASLSSEGLPPAAAPGPRAPRPQPQLRTLAEYRRIVERWIVPDYNGAKKPRAIWETPRGVIELELYPGDAPLGLEYLVRVTDSKEIVGTTFTRVVPNFVAQQRGIRNDVVLRDEVSRRGLIRGNLSWASAGLDTGRPGYTIGVTPQPHNEGNFTALGRVVRGIEVVERLELMDAITAARMVR